MKFILDGTKVRVVNHEGHRNVGFIGYAYEIGSVTSDSPPSPAYLVLKEPRGRQSTVQDEILCYISDIEPIEENGV